MEDEMVVWHHQFDEYEFEQAPAFGDGQGKLACCSPWCHRERQLSDGTELNFLLYIKHCEFFFFFLATSYFCALQIFQSFVLGMVKQGSQVVVVVKNPPANAGDIRDMGSIPGLGRSRGGGHGNPFQYSCLENPLDRGASQATDHRVTK